MRIHVLSLQIKEVTSKKTGEIIHLRIVQGHDAEGNVFRSMLPKGHEDIGPGVYEVGSDIYIDYEAELAARLKFTLVEQPQRSRPAPAA